MSRNKPKEKASFWNKIRWKTLIIVSSIATIVILPIVLLSINWTNISILYASGSSAVFPLMKQLSSVYQANREDKPSIDIAIEATGSGSGLEKILNNTTNFGNISFSPTAKLVKEYYHDWKNSMIKTVSWGIDGISLVYRGDFNLDINDQNIDDIYIAFSGIRELTYHDLGINSSVIVKPYARTGGANKSGTTEAFIADSGFNINSSNNLINNAIENIKAGQYGNNVQTTKESQVETWHQMSINPEPGQITYLSTGFVLQNEAEIKRSGYKIASYKHHQLSKENIRLGHYNWRRILNSLISLKNADQILKDWVSWILLEHYNDAYITKVFDDIGIVQFNQNQIKQMTLNDDFWVSDFVLKDPNSVNDNFNYGVRLN